MPELPPCGNFKSGTCERNEVHISRETDDAFVIHCRCCNSFAVWPKEKPENAGRYQAFLKKQAQLESEEKIRGLAPLYSIPSLNPGVKAR